MSARVSHPAIFLCLVCACSFEAKCGSGGGLDAEKVTKAIEEEFARIDAALEKIECPEDLPSGKGKSFQCTVFFKDSGGLSIPVEVSQPSPGRLEFEHQTIVPSERAEKLVEDHLKKTANHDTAVDCGVRVRLPAKGEKFECSFEFGGARYPVQILFKDDEGNVSSQIQAVFSQEVEADLPKTMPPGGPSPDGMNADCGPRLHPLVMQSTFPCQLQFSDGSRWVATVAIEPSQTAPFSYRVLKVDPAN